MEEGRIILQGSYICTKTTECTWALPNYFIHLPNLNLNWLNLLKVPIKTHAIGKNFIHVDA